MLDLEKKAQAQQMILEDIQIMYTERGTLNNQSKLVVQANKEQLEANSVAA